MTGKVKAKSCILEAVHETSSDLHRLGFINKRKMHELEALCLTIDVPEKKTQAVRPKNCSTYLTGKDWKH